MSANIAELDQQLNARILAGDILGAFDEYYADDVVMQENATEPSAGKAANRVREEQFVGSIEAFHGGKLVNSAVNGNVAFGEWEYDVTFKGAGRVLMTQVAVRTWNGDGKVAFERFYHNKG